MFCFLSFIKWEVFAESCSIVCFPHILKDLGQLMIYIVQWNFFFLGGGAVKMHLFPIEKADPPPKLYWPAPAGVAHVHRRLFPVQNCPYDPHGSLEKHWPVGISLGEGIGLFSFTFFLKDHYFTSTNLLLPYFYNLKTIKKD